MNRQVQGQGPLRGQTQTQGRTQTQTQSPTGAGEGRRWRLQVVHRTTFSYSGPVRSSYNEAAAKDGWTRMLAHFAANHAAPGKAKGWFG